MSNTTPTNSPAYPRVTIDAVGIGALTAVPAASTNGTAIGTKPVGFPETIGVAIFIPPNGSITYTIATSAPTSAPGSTLTYAQGGTATVPIEVDVDLKGSSMVYVTAMSGGCMFRWI